MKVYTTQNQTYKYRKQTCGYPKREGRGDGHVRGVGFREKNHSA